MFRAILSDLIGIGLQTIVLAALAYLNEQIGIFEIFQSGFDCGFYVYAWAAIALSTLLQYNVETMAKPIFSETCVLLVIHFLLGVISDRSRETFFCELNVRPQFRSVQCKPVGKRKLGYTLLVALCLVAKVRTAVYLIYGLGYAFTSWLRGDSNSD